jgi:hypothetical protein
MSHNRITSLPSQKLLDLVTAAANFLKENRDRIIDKMGDMRVKFDYSALEDFARDVNCDMHGFAA